MSNNYMIVDIMVSLLASALQIRRCGLRTGLVCPSQDMPQRVLITNVEDLVERKLPIIDVDDLLVIWLIRPFYLLSKLFNCILTIANHYQYHLGQERPIADKTFPACDYLLLTQIDSGLVAGRRHDCLINLLQDLMRIQHWISRLMREVIALRCEKLANESTYNNIL